MAIARAFLRGLRSATRSLAPTRSAKTVSKYAIGVTGSIGTVAPNAVDNGSAPVRCILIHGATSTSTTAATTTRATTTTTTTVGFRRFQWNGFASLVLQRRRRHVHGSAETLSSASGVLGMRWARAQPRAELARRRRCAASWRGSCPTQMSYRFKTMHSCRRSDSRARLRQPCSSHSLRCDFLRALRGHLAALCQIVPVRPYALARAVERASPKHQKGRNRCSNSQGSPCSVGGSSGLHGRFFFATRAL